MISCVYQLVWAVCVLMSGLPQTSADFSTERGKVSEACNKTLDTCVNLAGSPVPSIDALWCTLFEASVNGVSAYQCVVRIGLCTDEEFVALKNAACGQTATAQHTSSALKTSVYNVVNSTSETCQNEILEGIFSSGLATVLKQQEQYCKLMKLAGTTLAPICSSAEITNLNTTACSTTQSQPFSDAIVAASQMCQDGMESCTYGVHEAFALIQGEKYCDAINLLVRTPVNDCLIKAGCTDSEVSKIKTAACSGSNVVASVIMLALAALYQLF